MSEFTEGVLFGAFVEETRRWMKATSKALEGIMSDIGDMSVKLDAQTAAIGQEAIDLQEMEDRVNALVDAISSQIPALEAANAALTTERDNLATELGDAHAAVGAANAVIDANTANIAALSASLDAFKAPVAEEPPA